MLGRVTLPELADVGELPSDGGQLGHHPRRRPHEQVKRRLAGDEAREHLPTGQRQQARQRGQQVGERAAVIVEGERLARQPANWRAKLSVESCSRGWITSPHHLRRPVVAQEHRQEPELKLLRCQRRSIEDEPRVEQVERMLTVEGGDQLAAEEFGFGHNRRRYEAAELVLCRVTQVELADVKGAAAEGGGRG